VKERIDPGREARNSTQLTGIDGVDDVHDLRGRNAHDVAGKAGVGHIAGVPAQEVVGHAAPDRIELDPLPDDVAAGHDLVSVQRQHLRRKHLQLEWDREPILRPARPEPKEHLARDEHLARGAPLQPIEVREGLGVGLVGPVEPDLLHLRLECGLHDQGRRLDAGADHIAGPALNRISRVAIVAHEPAGARRDVRPGGGNERVQMRPARLETLEPTARQACLEPANERTDLAADGLQRSEHLETFRR
jgi:hypothetical protein